MGHGKTIRKKTASACLAALALLGSMVYYKIDMSRQARQDMQPALYVVQEAVAAEAARYTPVPKIDDFENRPPININTASQLELTLLPGIGEKLAQRIVDYRDAHGPFAAPEEIMNVSGIGEGKYEAIREAITTD